jgi:hypothetical protein
MVLAMLCFVIGQRSGVGWFVVVGSAFMIADLVCIFSAVRRAS